MVDDGFGDMVKYVVDVARGVIALGGELHADAEARLLADGSRQADLWGANLYPRLPPAERIEFTSLINIRPSAGNPSMEVRDEGIRQRIREITEQLILGTEDALTEGPS
jgi:hypothetical protein